MSAMEAGLPDVTVCIPAYNSGDFIERTLAAARRQTYAHIRVLISIDGPDPGTEAACRRFSDADPRFEVILQNHRLGWLANTNALFDRVATEFFFILPHDDVIADNYVEVLRTEALAYPEALVVFSDMHRSGYRRDDVISTPGLDGPFLERVMALVSAPTEGVAWRGLTRSAVLADGLRMRDNAFDNYNSHALWVLALLCRGPFRHIPLPLYRQFERKAEESVTIGWRSWPADRLYAAMAEYTLHCIETVSEAGDASPADRHTLVLLLILRLLAHPSFKAVADEWPSVDRYLIRVAELVARMQGLGFQDRETTRLLQRNRGLQRGMAKLRVRDAGEAIARNDLAAAAVALDSALGLDPENGEAYLRKAILLRRQKRIKDALAAIKVAQCLLPANANVRVELADLLVRAGDPESAVEAARGAIALDPNSANAHYHLSIALSRSGRMTEALAAAERAATAAPGQARFRDHYEDLERQAGAAGGTGGVRTNS